MLPLATRPQRVCWTEESSLHSEMDDAESAMAASLRHIMGTQSHGNCMRSYHACTPGHYSRGLPRWSPCRERWYRRILDTTQGNRRGHLVPWPCCRTPVSPWQGPSNPSFRTSRSHEPNLSYSNRVFPMTSGLSENTALPVTGQHRHEQPRPRSRRQSLQPRANQYPQTFFDFGGCHYLVARDRLSGWIEIFQASSWNKTSRYSRPNCSPQSTIRYVRCTWGNIQWRWSRILISRYYRLSNQMGSPSSHVLRVFPPVKRSCRSGGQKGKAHANGQRWPQWVSEQRWPPACKTPDPDCNISPTQVVFGKPIRDAFSFISRCIKYNSQSIRLTWREAWSQKEDAMRARMPRST